MSDIRFHVLDKPPSYKIVYRADRNSEAFRKEFPGCIPRIQILQELTETVCLENNKFFVAQREIHDIQPFVGISTNPPIASISTNTPPLLALPVVIFLWVMVGFKKLQR